MTIETPRGKIEAIPNPDPHYPGIYVYINDVLACIVEYDESKDKLRVHAYNDKDDEPEVSIDWNSDGPVFTCPPY